MVASPQTVVVLTDHPAWKDQGIENLAKSPHAKLRNIPVRAVTIQEGSWRRRRDINVKQEHPPDARSARSEWAHVIIPDENLDFVVLPSSDHIDVGFAPYTCADDLICQQSS